MKLPTASQLERAAICPGSAALPHVQNITPAAERGTAIHAFLQRAASVGRDAALVDVPNDWRPACEAIDLDSLPQVDASAYAAEVALAFNLTDGTARELGRNIGRDYTIAGDEMAGTADVLAVAQRSALVGDFKSGRGHVSRARDNWQLKFLVLAACRAYGRERGDAVIIRLRENDEPWFDHAEFDAFDLDEIESQLGNVVADIIDARADVAAGHLPKLVTGDHCRYCASFTHCPAQTGLMRTIVEDPRAITRAVSDQLTPANAADAYRKWRELKMLMDRVSDALVNYAIANPIDLGDGVVYGPVVSTREELDGTIGRQALIDWLYANHPQQHDSQTIAIADKACSFDITKKGIEEVARIIAQRTGVKIAPTTKSILQAIRDAGGSTIKTSARPKEHRPALSAPAEKGI